MGLGSSGSWIRRIRSPWLPALVGAACMFATLPNPLVRDDALILANDPRLSNPFDFKAIWLTDWWGAWTPEGRREVPIERDYLYRPFTLWTFALQQHLTGPSPVYFRIGNILLHSLACALLCLLARRLIGNEWVASAAALLFAVHPVHVEPIAELVGRTEILATVLLNAGLLALLPRARPPGWGRFALAAAAFLLALLSKETAISYLPIALVILLHELRISRRWPGSRTAPVLARCALLLVPLLVYFPLRYSATAGHLFNSRPMSLIANPVADTSGVERVATSLAVAGQYTRLLLWPRRLTTDYGYAVIDPAAGFDGTALLGAAALLLLAVGSIRWLIALAKNRSAAGPESHYSSLFSVLLLLSYILFSNSVLTIGVAVGERLFYWPSVWASLLLASLVDRWAVAPSRAGAARLELRRRAIVLASILALAALASRSILREFDWRTPDRLWAANLAAFPRSVGSSLNLAKDNLRRAVATQTRPVRERLLEQASETLSAALALKPQSPELLRQAGLVAFARGQVGPAAQYFQLALQYDPGDMISRGALAEFRGATSNAADRLAALEATARANPADPAAQIALGAHLLNVGQTERALKCFAAAVEAAPENAAALRAYGQALLVAGRRDAAREPLLKAVERDPGDWRSHTNLFAALEHSDPKAALLHAEKAAQLNSADLTVRLNLAEAYGLNGRYADGLKVFRATLAGLPAGDANRPLIESRIKAFEAALR